MPTFLARVRAAARAAIGLYPPQSVTPAYGLLTGIQPGGLGQPPKLGTAQYLQAYNDMPWLRAVAGRIATGVAAAEWQLYVRGRPGERARRDPALQRAKASRRADLRKAAAAVDDLREITDHPLLDLLHSSNTFQTGGALWKTTQLHLDLVGEAFWIKERDGLGTVVGLWPVPPYWVINTPTPTNPVYRVQFRAWRGLIPDSEILWMADPDPVHPYGRGSGTAVSLGDELETDEWAAKHLKSFFYNRARPDLIVYPKQGVIRPDVVERMEEQWLEKNQGFFRAFKPYFLSREVEIKELDQNFRSLQMVQLREYERNVIIQTFGMPPELLGVLEHSNRATISAADYLFSRYLVQPRLEFLRAVLQERLVPEFDERLVIDYASPVERDETVALDAAKAAPWAATVDEWREKQGLPPLPDEAGAVHVIDSKLLVQALGAPAGPLAGAVPASLGAGIARRTSRPALPRAAAALLRASGDPEEAAWVQRRQAETGEDLPPASAVAAQHEPRLARQLRASWARAYDEASVAQLQDAARRGDVEGLLRALRLDALARDHGTAVRPLLAAIFLDGARVGATALRALGVPVRRAVDPVDFAAVNPAAVAWAEAHAAGLVDAPADVRAAIQALVVRSEQGALTADRLAAAVRELVGLTARQAAAVDRFRTQLDADGVAAEAADRRTARYAAAQRRMRSETIARTETVAASNAGQQALWEQAAAQGHLDARDVQRTWLTAGDDLVEEDCSELADTTTGLTEPFAGGIFAPPLHPRCRCSLGLVGRS